MCLLAQRALRRSLVKTSAAFIARAKQTANLAYALKLIVTKKCACDNVFRGLVNRAKLRATTLRRSPRRSRKISSSDPALNNLVALPNELLCKVLAYWHA